MAQTAALSGAPPINDQREIFGWIMYDWANSVFSTTVFTTLLGPYLTALAQAAVGENGVVLAAGPLTVTAKGFFTFCISTSVLLQVFLLPVLGAVADYTNLKKRLMMGFCYLGVVATCLLFLTQQDTYLLGGLLFIVANVGFGGSIVLYNAYLAEITTEDQRDKVSSRGFAMGYLGGGLLLLANLALVLGGKGLGISTDLAVRISLVSAGLWWGGFAAFTFTRLRARGAPRPPAPGTNIVTLSLRELGGTFRELRRLPHTLQFLVGYLFYNDGIQTVIGVASVFFAQELFVARGLPTSQTFLIGLILMVQFVAFGGALLFERIAGLIGAKRAILLSLVIWCAVVLYAYFFFQTQTEAWVMGAVIAVVLGGSQALSRSLFSRMIPRSKEASFFGLYEISERGTSWIGPLIFTIVVASTNSSRQAIVSVIALLVIGMVVLAFTNTRQAVHDSGNALPEEVAPVAGEPA
jgi:MFS transporter, UMF1 family